MISLLHPFVILIVIYWGIFDTIKQPPKINFSDLIQQIASCKYYHPDHKVFFSRPINSLFLLHLHI